MITNINHLRETGTGKAGWNQEKNWELLLNDYGWNLRKTQQNLKQKRQHKSVLKN